MGLTDKLKDAVSGHGSTGAQGATGGQGAAGGATGGSAAGGAGGAGAPGTDYGDKALNFVEQKTGHKLDPNTNEKITDGARGVYEKTTGQHVNPKFSN